MIQSDFVRFGSKTTAAESEAVRTFDEFTGKAVEVSRTVTSDFAQQWCRRARLPRWRTTRMLFARLMGSLVVYLSCEDETMPNKMKVLFATLTVSITVHSVKL